MTVVSFLTVTAAVALAVVVAAVPQVRGPRSRLLWLAALTLLASVLLREYGASYGDTPALDLVKRLVFLATLTSVLVLVLSFRKVRLTRRAYWWLWALAGMVGVAECLLTVLMPTQADGTLYAYTEASRSLAVFAYYALYETAIGITVGVCGAGSLSVLVRTRQPALARVSLALGTLAAVTTVAYVCVGWLCLVEDPGFDYLVVRHHLFLATIALLLTGLGVGGVRKIVEGVRH